LDKNKIKEEKQDSQHDDYVFDPLKISYIEKLIDDVGKDSIVLIVSPLWYGLDKSSFEPVRELCLKKGVKFYDFANDSKYVHNDYFFKDGGHLNFRGADEFTKDLVQAIKD
jgi:hypothetical protein